MRPATLLVGEGIADGLEPVGVSVKQEDSIFSRFVKLRFCYTSEKNHPLS